MNVASSLILKYELTQKRYTGALKLTVGNQQKEYGIEINEGDGFPIFKIVKKDEVLFVLDSKQPPAKEEIKKWSDAKMGFLWILLVIYEPMNELDREVLGSMRYAPEQEGIPLQSVTQTWENPHPSLSAKQEAYVQAMINNY